MTGEEKDLLKKYLTELNVLGPDGSHPHFEAWYQEVRYAQGPNAPRTVMEASELRYKDILEAARVQPAEGKHKTRDQIAATKENIPALNRTFQPQDLSDDSHNRQRSPSREKREWPWTCPESPTLHALPPRAILPNHTD